LKLQPNRVAGGFSPPGRVEGAPYGSPNPLRTWRARQGDRIPSGSASMRRSPAAISSRFLFNYLFLIPELMPFSQYLQGQVHGTPGDESFMKVWDSSRCGLQRSLAYGFLSHNDVWGADYTAHHKACTTGLNEGYVITKARWLEKSLTDVWSAYRCRDNHCIR